MFEALFDVLTDIRYWAGYASGMAVLTVFEFATARWENRRKPQRFDEVA